MKWPLCVLVFAVLVLLPLLPARSAQRLWSPARLVQYRTASSTPLVFSAGFPGRPLPLRTEAASVDLAAEVTSGGPRSPGGVANVLSNILLAAAISLLLPGLLFVHNWLFPPHRGPADTVPLASSHLAPAVLAAAAAAYTAGAGPALAAASGEELFQSKCAACHANGGNVTNPFKTLQRASLQSDGLPDAEAIGAVVETGQGPMPGYGESCAPQGRCTFGPRLTPGDVQAVAEYVVRRAEAGWTG
eukprot:EG_transcript_17930